MLSAAPVPVRSARRTALLLLPTLPCLHHPGGRQSPAACQVEYGVRSLDEGRSTIMRCRDTAGGERFGVCGAGFQGHRATQHSARRHPAPLRCSHITRASCPAWPPARQCMPAYAHPSGDASGTPWSCCGGGRDGRGAAAGTCATSLAAARPSGFTRWRHGSEADTCKDVSSRSSSRHAGDHAKNVGRWRLGLHAGSAPLPAQPAALRRALSRVSSCAMKMSAGNSCLPGCSCSTYQSRRSPQ